MNNDNDNEFHLNISPNQWFNVSINNDKLEVFSNDKNNTPILIFDFKRGDCNLLNKYYSKVYFNNPTINAQQSPDQIFYNFIAVLRDKNHE